MVATLLALGGLVLVQSDKAAGDVIAIGVPVWIADLALPIGFGLIALRLVWRASPHWIGRAIAAIGIVAGFAIHAVSRVVRGPVAPAVARADSRRGHSRRADFRAARRHRDLRVARPRQSAGRAARQGVRRADDVDGPRRDSAVHARRVSARRRQVVGAAAARVPRAGSAGRRAGPPSPPRRSARSSRCSPADRASRFSCSAACCCRRSSRIAIASAFRSACSPRPDRSACCFRSRCR